MSNTETEVTSQDFVMEDRQYPACSKYHFRKLFGDRGMRIIYKFFLFSVLISYDHNESCIESSPALQRPKYQKPTTAT